MKALPRVAALGVALLLAVLYALFASSDPSAAFAAFFIGPFSNAYSMNALLESAAPLLACALGACIAFRAGSFNLGGEGQAAVGTLAAALAGSALGGHSGLPAMAGIAVVTAQAGLHGFAHHVLNLAGDGESAFAFHLVGFDEEDIAAGRGPGEADDDAGALGALGDFAFAADFDAAKKFLNDLLGNLPACRSCLRQCGAPACGRWCRWCVRGCGLRLRGCSGG